MPVRVALIDADSICHSLNWTYKGKEAGKAYKQLKSILTSIEEFLFADFSLIAVKDPTANYRMDIYPDYKAKRKPSKFPTDIVKTLRSNLVDEGLAIPSWGREADDLMRIWREEAVLAGHEPIVCSIDKDLDCIPGLHCYIKKLDSLEVYHVSPEDAERHYWEQVLKGDPSVDNIPGIPGIGPTKAKAMLADCHTTEEYEAAAVLAYRAYYGDDWHQYLLANGKLIHLQRSVNDYFKIDKKKYNKEKT